MATRASAILEKLLFHSPFSFPSPPTPPPPKFAAFHRFRCGFSLTSSSSASAVSNFYATSTSNSATSGSSPVSGCDTKNEKKKKKKKKEREKQESISRKIEAESALKRRTRSGKEFDEETVLRFGDGAAHVPVMLGEVLEVFASLPLRSFVDCTLGAAGHSSAIIQNHPEMQLYVGLDVDPTAHGKARARIDEITHKCSSISTCELKVHTLISNFRDIKSALHKVDEKKPTPRIDGILMDLGMSSMQVNNAERGFSVLNNGPLDMRMNPLATLKAEDILNSWPDTEVGRILREYGEESNWRFLQKKIVEARHYGGLHSTGQLVDLIRTSAFRTKGGRQGWIKTATRVFQALRIAVNDELRTLEDSLGACFECLGPGGRLAVISFHSLEDRLVKQTFLNIINGNNDGTDGNDDEEERSNKDYGKINDENEEREAWIRQTVQGCNGTILTKRPITPSEEEEKLNRRSRSAKLRVIQKAGKI